MKNTNGNIPPLKYSAYIILYIVGNDKKKIGYLFNFIFDNFLRVIIKVLLDKTLGFII